jgi:O-antigen ligase
MDFSPILGLEGGLAALLVLGILCAKPESDLFLYGLALGFPDLALPFGTAINLRIDDALIVFLLIRSIVWTPAPFGPGQRKILAWQAILLLACAISGVIGYGMGNPPEDYNWIKMIGCGVIVFALPRVLQSERRLRFLVAGLMCAGIALIVQMILRLGASPLNSTTNFQRFKSAASFATWNPNTIGQAAMLVVFAAGVGWIVFPRTRASRLFWFCLSIGFALTPALVFVRGTSISIVAAYVLFLCLVRSWKWAAIFLLVWCGTFFYLQSANRGLVQEATRVDLSTGEGLGDRFERWDDAMRAIRAAPFLGQGFGQELNYLSDRGNGFIAHNAYLSVWIELGIGGLLLLLVLIYQFVAAGLSLYRTPEFQLSGALVLALIAAACVDSVALPTLYWEKLPTISLSIAVSLIGICERRGLDASTQTVGDPGIELFPEQV